MNTTNTAVQPVQAARALLKDLQTLAAFRDCLPLAIGIDKQLLQRMPDLDRKLVRIALGLHTNSLRYLKSIEKATSRFDLDGNPSGEVTEAQRKHASEILRERFRKSAEQRKAQRQEEEAERRRAEKLAQLAEKFSRNSR